VLNELALFAGAGGGLLGSRLLGWKTVCYVENNPYCVSVLEARIGDGYLDDAPIWGDIKTFDGKPWAGLVDVITAGFPCQPFSVAGKQKTDADERNLWPDSIRVIQEVQPEFVLLENVPGLLSATSSAEQERPRCPNCGRGLVSSDARLVRYLGTIFRDLSKSGYNARWRIVSAADVGAPHLRKRLWIMAYNTSV
jgi:DNA (cytosine-5)-methyltransferase 1